MKTCRCNVDPPFYIVKLGLTGVYIIFLFLLLNIDCGYLLEKGGNEAVLTCTMYQQSMF